LAIAHVQSFAEGSGSGNGFTSGSFDDTGANFRHAFLCQQGARDGVVSDNDLNTWQQASQVNGGFAAGLDSWYAYDIVGDSGSTVSVTGSGTLPSLAVSSFSGVDDAADPLDQDAGTSNLFQGDIQAGSVTPSTDDQLVLAGLGALGDDDPPSIDGGFTLGPSVGAVGSQHLSVATSYLIQTTAAAANPQYTYNGTENVAINVTFKAASGGTQSYPYSATGGLTIAGTAARAKVAAVLSAGGLQTGGTAARANVRVVVAAGGLSLGGGAAFAKGLQVAAAGGLTLAGTAARAKVNAPVPAGGLNLGGSAGYSSSGTQTYSYSATGGLTMAGTAAYARVTIRIPAGGLQMGGAAAVSTHESTRTVTPAGGIILSGAASVQTLVAGGMLDELLRDGRRRGYVRTLYGRG
jgi:hypothetical protein